MRKRKTFSLVWAFEPFEENDEFFTKRMFGGLAAYVGDRLVMLLSEKTGDLEWKDQKFDFDLWNGILIPTSREHHENIQKDFPNVISHPVLGKWLFLKMNDPEFESTALSIGQNIAKGDVRFGIISTPKRK